jgi:hypothetical protein
MAESRRQLGRSPPMLKCSRSVANRLQVRPNGISRVFCRAPARLPVPRQMRGRWRAQVAQPLFCRAAFPLENAGRLSARHRGLLRPAAGPRFAGVVRLVDGRRQPAPGGQPLGRRAEPRRRPSACFARHARRRRILLHHKDASRRRPSISRIAIGLSSSRNKVNSALGGRRNLA